MQVSRLPLLSVSVQRPRHQSLHQRTHSVHACSLYGDRQARRGCNLSVRLSSPAVLMLTALYFYFAHGRRWEGREGRYQRGQEQISIVNIQNLHSALHLHIVQHYHIMIINTNIRPLTPKSMPPANDEHVKLKILLLVANNTPALPQTPPPCLDNACIHTPLHQPHYTHRHA